MSQFQNKLRHQPRGPPRGLFSTFSFVRGPSSFPQLGSPSLKKQASLSTISTFSFSVLNHVPCVAIIPFNRQESSQVNSRKYHVWFCPYIYLAGTHIFLLQKPSRSFEASFDSKAFTNQPPHVSSAVFWSYAPSLWTRLLIPSILCLARDPHPPRPSFRGAPCQHGQCVYHSTIIFVPL